MARVRVGQLRPGSVNRSSLDFPLIFKIVSLTILISSPTFAREVFIELGSDWRFFKGSTAPSDDGPPAKDWRTRDFDHSSWPIGRAPIGYEDGEEDPERRNMITTALHDMRKTESRPGYASFYVRKVFEVTRHQLEKVTQAEIGNLYLGIAWDDGFIAYLNGAEVLRWNMGRPGQEFAHNDLASGLHEALSAQTFPIPYESLVEGRNVLAIEIHNYSLDSTDCSIDAQLWGEDPLEANCPIGELGCGELFGQVLIDYHLPGRAKFGTYSLLRNGKVIQTLPFLENRRRISDSTITLADIKSLDSLEYTLSTVVDGQLCEELSCSLSLCPEHLTWSASPDEIHLSWRKTTLIDYESTIVLRDGVPVEGSPFPGSITQFVDKNPGEGNHEYTIIATANGKGCSQPLITTAHVAPQFILGDLNGDGYIDISDVDLLFNYTHSGEATPWCTLAGDLDGDGSVHAADGGKFFHALCDGNLPTSVLLPASPEEFCIDPPPTPRDLAEVTYQLRAPGLDTLQARRVTPINIEVSVKDNKVESSPHALSFSIGVENLKIISLERKDSISGAACSNIVDPLIEVEGSPQGNGAFINLFSSFGAVKPIELNEEPQTIAHLFVEPTCTDCTARIFFKDGLLAEGVIPSRNVVSFDGDPQTPIEMSSLELTVIGESFFKRGDADGSGNLNITDAIAILYTLFLGENRVPCKKSADVNDDGLLEVADVVSLITYLFLSGKTPTEPFIECGTDNTPDELPCDFFPPCGIS